MLLGEGGLMRRVPGQDGREGELREDEFKKV